MNVVVHPSAHETFTPREITTAYKQFEERGPQCVDAESGFGAAAYRFGTRVLLVYEEFETGVVVLMSSHGAEGQKPFALRPYD